MRKIVISTIELLRISYLARHDSLIRIKSNKNILNITLDRFSRAKARLEFGIDIEIEPNIDIIIKASDFIAATNNIVNIKKYYWRDFMHAILEGSGDNFSELEASSTIYFDVKK